MNLVGFTLITVFGLVCRAYPAMARIAVRRNSFPGSPDRRVVLFSKSYNIRKQAAIAGNFVPLSALGEVLILLGMPFFGGQYAEKRAPRPMGAPPGPCRFRAKVACAGQFCTRQCGPISSEIFAAGMELAEIPNGRGDRPQARIFLPNTTIAAVQIALGCIIHQRRRAQMRPLRRIGSVDIRPNDPRFGIRRRWTEVRFAALIGATGGVQGRRHHGSAPCKGDPVDLKLGRPMRAAA